MPLYAYHCDRCNTDFEFFQHFTDDQKTVCPDCQTVTLRKTYTPTPVHFKGQGWYVKEKYNPAKQA